MLIQVFSEYLQLAQVGKVNFLTCPMHPTEEATFPLVHNLTDQDQILLKCFACGYKSYVGQQMYDNLITIINAVNNEPKKVDTQITIDPMTQI